MNDTSLNTIHNAVYLFHEEEKLQKLSYDLQNQNEFLGEEVHLALAAHQEVIVSIRRKKYFNCSLCSRKYMKKQSSQLHIKSIHENSKFKCNFCKKNQHKQKQNEKWHVQIQLPIILMKDLLHVNNLQQ